MELEEVIEFIGECEPKFSKGMDDKHCMFTVVTQHIRADSVEELLEEGISTYKERGNKSALRALFEKIEDEGIYFKPEKGND